MSPSSLLPTPYPLPQSLPVLALGPARSTEPGPDPTPSSDPSLSPDPSPSSVSPLVQPDLSGGLSAPAIVGFAGFGAFAFGILILCAWRRFTGRDVVMPGFLRRRSISQYQHRRQQQQQQQLRADGHGSKEKPVMFDAWTVRRTADVLKWEEESVPVSATLFTGVQRSECMEEKVATLRLRVGEDDDDIETLENEEDEKRLALREGAESLLQVAVLLQMPSPPNCAEARNNVDEEALGSSFRGELAVGLMELPWIREEHCSRKSTTSSS